MRGVHIVGVLAVALVGCRSMSDYRPAGGRAITHDEHRRMIAECRLAAQTAVTPLAGLGGAIPRRGRYDDCMTVHGWERGEPTFVEGASVSDQRLDASGVCGDRVSDAIERGLATDQISRVLDGCMAEHGL